MSKYTPVTDEELEQINRETAERAEREPRIVHFCHNRATDNFEILLKNEVSVKIPARVFSAFDGASPKQKGVTEVVSGGNAVHWPELDVQMSTIALLQVALKMPSIQSVGSKGGKARTEAKQAASRENGKKGGRPSKKEVAGVV